MAFLYFIAAVVGFGIGGFAAPNILLPLLWAWPRVRRLEREGKLATPIPAAMFVVAPLVWGITLAGSILLAAVALPSLAIAYSTGLVVGFGQAARLAANPSQQREADFADTYGRYLKPSQLEKEVSAIQRIVANWVEMMTEEVRADHAPLVLRLNDPDARFRHLLFCLETVYYFSVASMADGAKQQAIAQESCARIVGFATSYRGEGRIFSGVVDSDKLSAQASAHLHYFSTTWAAYMQHLADKKGKGRTDETATRVAAMLRYVEAEASLGSDDAKRLWPLARWIEDRLLSLEPSFVELSQS